MFEDLRKALKQHNVMYVPGLCSYSLHCTYMDLRFDAEISRVPHLNLHGFQFHRIKGDATTYKQVCSALLQQLKV